MSGTVAVIVKLMPESPDIRLWDIRDEVANVLEQPGAQNISFEEKAMAFGLRALFVKFAWPEDEDTSVFEDSLGKIVGVSSVQVEDYRRAFG